MRSLTFLLMLVILLISGCTSVDTVKAGNRSEVVTQTEEAPMTSPSSLSAADQQKLLAAIATQQNIPVNQLQITATQEADWPDGCLGLAGPDEFCTQMIVPGWAIIVSNGDQTWNYRTDLDLMQVKLDPNP